MNIFHLIYIPIILYAFRNYHKAFLLYAITKPFLHNMIPFLFAPGIPLIQMETFMNTFFLMCVILNHISKKEFKIANSSFPLKRAFFVYITSISVSSALSSITPILQSTMTGYQIILNDFIFVCLLYTELKNRQNIRFFIKGLVVVFSIAILYGIFERVNDFYNPLREYQKILNPSDGLTFDNPDARGGVGRVKSIFNNALSCSAYAAVALTFFFYINMRYKKTWNSPILIRVSFLAGLLLLLLMANTRGGILYTGVLMLFMLNLKTMLLIALFLPIFGILFYDFVAPYMLTILSIFSSSASEEARGSNFAMRVMQFLAMIPIWMDSFFFGYGMQGERYWPQQVPALLGTESIWLKLPINQGFFGIIAYVYLLISMVKFAIGKAKRYVIGSILACLALMTTTIWLPISFFISTLFIVYRLELLSKKEEMQYVTG